MKIDHINAVLTATSAVLESLECTGVDSRGVQVLCDPFPATDTASVAIGINGGLEGSLVLLFSFEAAAPLASVLCQAPVAPEDRDEVCDCMGELANIIAGYLVTSLASCEIRIDITPPTVVSGPTARLEIPEGASTVLSPITLDQGQFELLWSVREPTG